MSRNKSGAPPCGLYARIDDFGDVVKTIGAIRQMASVINRASGYEQNMHVLEFAAGVPEDAEKIADLITIMKAQGMVCVVSGATLDQAGGALGMADGFVLSSAQDLAAFRAALGDDPILGLVTKDAPDARADYVILPADPALIAKIGGGGDVVVCARGEGITNDNAGALARAGASFIDCGDYIFSHEKGVMQGAVNMLYALELAADDTGAAPLN